MTFEDMREIQNKFMALQQYKVFKLKENSNYHSFSRYKEIIEKYFSYLKERFG